MENWINLNNLPRRKDGKISWKDCDHNLVEFCYKDQINNLYVEKRINDRKIQILFKDKLFDFDILSLTRCCLGKLFDFAIANNYYYNIGDIIEEDYRHLLIVFLERIGYSNGKTSKGYKVKCLICNNVFIISEANLLRGDGCNICSHHKLQVGINDLWTTRPDIAKMLSNSNDGYKYMQYSNKSADFICPNCGEFIGNLFIHNVTRFGLTCPKCGSGITYPNKLMYNLLSFFEEDFSHECVFEWCHFPDYHDNTKVSTGRYDFVINNKNIIIEMDGGFGHGNDPFPGSRYTKEELIYRDKMKDLLASQHGYDVIRIDCNYSMNDRLKYCSNNILNSKLNDLYDFDSVDWIMINSKCLTQVK